jgi:hypothetical protein
LAALQATDRLKAELCKNLKNMLLINELRSLDVDFAMLDQDQISALER